MEDNTSQDAAMTATTESRTTPSGGTYTKRRSFNPGTKTVKLPPIVSPGLLDVTKPNPTTPAQLFDQAMQEAGYQPEKSLHRGSSIRRTVGDMFDSNVMLTRHFPSMVPPDMFDSGTSAVPVTTTGGDNCSNSDTKVTAHTVIEALRQTLSASNDNNNERQSIMSFEEMLPVSLTVPLPESYVQERLKYVHAVEEREKAIIAKQEAEEEVEFGGADPIVVEVPPIPTPPEPPTLAISADDGTKNGHTQHPLYPPKDAHLVAHLDPQTFHITEGRYFGLLTNNVWDPIFVGPNLGSSGGGTLATGASSATQPLTLSSVLFSTTSSTGASTTTSTAVTTTNNSTMTQSQSSTGASSPAPTTPTLDSQKSTPVQVDVGSSNADAASATTNDTTAESKQE
jgi:hypothetical protein